MRSRHDFEVATWSGQLEVANKNGRCDLAGLATGGLASRPRFLGPDKGVQLREQRLVVTWIVGVVTWKSYYGQKRGRDMKFISRHRVVSRRVAT